MVFWASKSLISLNKILFKINNKYRYVYNITCYNLTDEQQYKLMAWIADKVKTNFVGSECGCTHRFYAARWPAMAIPRHHSIDWPWHAVSNWLDRSGNHHFSNH